jgi:hypothetical protein
MVESKIIIMIFLIIIAIVGATYYMFQMQMIPSFFQDTSMTKLTSKILGLENKISTLQNQLTHGAIVVPTNTNSHNTNEKNNSSKHREHGAEPVKQHVEHRTEEPVKQHVEHTNDDIEKMLNEPCLDIESSILNLRGCNQLILPKVDNCTTLIESDNEYSKSHSFDENTSIEDTPIEDTPINLSKEDTPINLSKEDVQKTFTKCKDVVQDSSKKLPLRLKNKLYL